MFKTASDFMHFELGDDSTRNLLGAASAQAKAKIKWRSKQANEQDISKEQKRTPWEGLPFRETKQAEKP